MFKNKKTNQNIVHLNPSFTSVSYSDDKEITYQVAEVVWCSCKVVVWLYNFD